MISKRLIFLYCLLSLFSVLLFSQDNTEQIQAEESLSPEKQRIEMEIKTSTLPELAVWSRSLGLPESGTRDELSRRLRQHFELPDQISTDDSGQRIITVNSAQTSEYFKIDTIDEEYARLRGDVSISLKDGDHIHSISAQEILFNRTRNTLTARGGVVYTKTTETDGTVETFRGENITVNIDTWAAVFMDGDSERTVDGDETTYRFSGTVISRTDEDTTILKKAVITNAATEEPLWSITASRLWLLPGSDFAFANAILKVGEIPIFYFPFFYLPADELIFHPVFGYRSREGGFVQTTTYLMGRPKADPEEQNSLAKIIGNSNDVERERHGIFLRTTGKKVINPNETSLRLLLDHYVNMGTFAGLELSLPRTGILSQPFDFSIGLGFTRTISSAGGYNPYYPDFDGTMDWNHSDFFSNTVPFRYKFHFKSAVSMRYGSISWDFPYYSDPYVDRDFFENRSESMDWFNIMQAAHDTSASSILGVPQWNVSGNITPNVRFLSPYISRISISTLSTSLKFTSLQDSSVSIDSPTRQFFAPDTYTIYNISAIISGTPYTSRGQSRMAPSETQNQYRNPLADIGEPVSPWEDNRTITEGITSGDIITPPALTQNFITPRDGNIRFGIDYSLRPASSSELQFRSGYSNWESADQVNWGEVQSIITSISGNLDINFRADHSSGLFSNIITLSGLGTWRDFTYINEEAEAYKTPQNPTGTPDPGKAEEARQQQYRHTRYSSSYAYTGTLRPFINDSIFSQSNFQYSFRGTLVSSKRYTPGTNNPELTPVWGGLVKENTSNDIYGLNSHRLTTNISASLLNRQQTLNLGVDLPPLEPLISANATFRIWYSETNINFRIRQAAEDALIKPGEWIYDPIHITETLRFRNNNTFVYHMVINPEENNDITNINTSLTLWNSSFRAAFSARRTLRAEFDMVNRRWEEYGEPVLQPELLSFSFNRNFQDIEIIKNIFGFSINIGTSLIFDLIRHTNSKFEFRLGVNLQITNFLKLELSATSDNSVIFRYFKGVPGMEHLTFMYPEGPQNNLFTDLLDSFNFSDNNMRRRSGFKIRSFDVKLTHLLGDWEAIFEVKMYPFINNSLAPPQYEIATDIGFIVQWKPISEIKTDVRHERQYDGWAIR